MVQYNQRRHLLAVAASTRVGVFLLGAKMAEDKRDFKGVWFPAEVWLDERLTALEKIILIEIDSLDGKNGCYASNEYLAKFCQCSQSKVSSAISKLKKLGYIRVKSFDGRKRFLESCLSVSVEQTNKKKNATQQNLEQRILSQTTSETTKENEEQIPFLEIIGYLNEKAKRKYRDAESHRKHIRARWNEYPDLTPEERLGMFRHCVDAMCSVWLDDPKMSMYLRPETLFGSKFDSYANQPISNGGKSSQRKASQPAHSEPMVGTIRTDNVTGKTDVYRGNGVWEEYVSSYVPQEEDEDIDF